MPLLGHSANVLDHLSVLGTSKVDGTPHLGVELELEFGKDPTQPSEPLTRLGWMRQRTDEQRAEGQAWLDRWYPSDTNSVERRNWQLSYYWEQGYDSYVRNWPSSVANGNREALLSTIGGLVSDFCILKRDGSLDDGVEIVSRPAFLAHHRDKWRPLFDAIGDGTVPLVAKRTCGMHVHVERSALVPGQIARMAMFLNNEPTRAFVQDVAGRKASHFCKVYDKGPDSYTSRDRYEALNTTPSRTVEVRIFASTVDWDEFVGRLEFVRALVSYCRPETRDVDRDVDIVQSENFVDWTRKRPRVYAALNAYLTNLGY